MSHSHGNFVTFFHIIFNYRYISVTLIFKMAFLIKMVTTNEILNYLSTTGSWLYVPKFNTGIKSFSFFCWTLCIVGQKVSTKSLMTAISLSPLREYCYYLVRSSNIRVKGDKMKRENNLIRLPLETWCSLSVPQCAASSKGNWNSWCLYARQSWPVVSPMVLVQGSQARFCAGAHGLELGLRCQVICVLLFLSNSSHCASYPTGITKRKTQGCHGYPMRSAWFVSWPHPVLSRHHSPSLSVVDEFNKQLHNREINY